MTRNIVICCDGTGNQYGSANSNVVKLYWTLSAQDKQVAYYHPGVGTMGSRNALTAVGKWWTRVRGLAFGYGFSDNIADVYLFLMNEFNPGDQIFIFGFSRGAYTARALCGLLLGMVLSRRSGPTQWGNLIDSPKTSRTTRTNGARVKSQSRQRPGMLPICSGILNFNA